MEADELPTYLVSQWLKTPITGCRFARMIASEKHDYVSIRLLTVRQAVGDPDLPEVIHGYLLQAAQDKSGVLFVFPNLRVDEDIADLVTVLAKHDAFTLTQKPWRPPGIRSEILLLLEWQTPAGYPSRTMGFAPSGTMPVVRRAPFVSLFVWTGGYDNHFRPKKPEWKTVGIVDMKHAFEKQQYDNLWEGSLEEKAERDKEEPTASASFRDVSFCLSERVRNRLAFK